jgi:hypothetical protein
MNLKHRLKHEWQDFLQSPPGRRFIDRYHRRRQQASSAYGRLISIAIGAVMLTAGLVMLFVPGPGIVSILLGLGVLAEQSQSVARALDWLDLRSRHIGKWLKGFWQQPT